jgi:hypothetical protein
VYTQDAEIKTVEKLPTDWRCAKCNRQPQPAKRDRLQKSYEFLAEREKRRDKWDRTPKGSAGFGPDEWV